MTSGITLWKPRKEALVPKTATTPAKIAEYAKQLTAREKKQLIGAFEAENFEIGSVFLWSRTMAALKKRLASLGTDFIGEMLDRPEIVAGVSLDQVITDFEAVSLAEELGMFSGTQAMRLRHSMELVAHFAAPPPDPDSEDAEREMMPEEAVQVFRACVQGILGHEQLDIGLEFARFRAQLEDRTFKPDDGEILTLTESPQFFQSTTTRVLMALVKTTHSAQLEHVIGNINVIIPTLWDNLYKPDRWLVGRAYAELHAAGQRVAASGVGKALLKVHGFDYVPEDLRSRIFIQTAKKVQEAHFATNNFYNEPAPMKSLERLGTVIPMPAFPQCMTAILCVRLGNFYGPSHSAQPTALAMLKAVDQDRWKYYLEQCLPADVIVLGKLLESNPASRWFSVVADHELADLDIENSAVRKLLDAARAKNLQRTTNSAESLINRASGTR